MRQQHADAQPDRPRPAGRRRPTTTSATSASAQNGGGVASLGVVGGNSKAQGCTGIPQPDGDYYAVDYVAHEMGHEFAGNHTFNGNILNCSGGNRNNATSVEPGSGSSIMAYAGICGTDDLQPHSDPYWSERSFDEITTYTSVARSPISEVQTASFFHFGGGNEVQTVTFGPGFSTTTSSFMVQIGGNNSVLIGAGGLAYSTANVQTAINGIAGFAGTVTVASASATGFTATYSGASTGLDVPNLGIVSLSCGGCFSSVQETNHGGANDSFSLSYGGGPNSPLITNGTNYTAAGIQTALQGVNEVQTVALTNYTVDGNSYTLTYNGNNSVPITRGQNNTAAGIAAAIGGGSESQAATTTGFVSGTSSYQVQYAGNNSVVLGAGGLAISTANIVAAITGIAGFPVGGTVSASGVSATTGNFTVTFGGTLANTDVSSLSVVNCLPACSAVVRENVKGTTGIAGWIPGTSVSVGTVADTGYTVTFNGLGDVNSLSVTNGTGSPAVTGTVTETTKGVLGILPLGATAAVSGFGGSGSPSSQGFQVTFGGTLALSAAVSLLSLTSLSAGLSGYVGETARGGPIQNLGYTITPTGNNPPVVTTAAGYTIPYLTPFALTGSAVDPDGDTPLYMWEQNDTGTGTPLVNEGQSPTTFKTTGPLFRQFGTRLDMSLYNPHVYATTYCTNGENCMNTDPTRVFPDMAQILANNTNVNNPAAGGIPGLCYPTSVTLVAPVANSIADCLSEYLPTYSATPSQNYAGPMHFRLTARDQRLGGGGVGSADTVISLAPATGPFMVTSQASGTTLYNGSTQTVTWNVAGTDVAPISTGTVKISLSTDGGSTYPYVLAAAAPNTGSAVVTLPDVISAHSRIKVEAVGNVYFDVNDADFAIVAAATTTTIAADFDPTQYSHPVTFTATVASVDPVAGTPTGSVQFYLDGAPVDGPTSLDGSGLATWTTSTLPIGTHVVSASFLGNDFFLPSASGPLNHVVKKRLATTTAVTSAGPVGFSAPWTLTTTITPESAGTGIAPTGTVQLMVDGVATGTPLPARRRHRHHI